MKHLAEPVDPADHRRGLGGQRLPEVFVEVLADRVVPAALHFLPADAQVLERTVNPAAAGIGRDDHDDVSAESVGVVAAGGDTAGEGAGVMGAIRAAYFSRATMRFSRIDRARGSSPSILAANCRAGPSYVSEIIFGSREIQRLTVSNFSWA